MLFNAHDKKFSLKISFDLITKFPRLMSIPIDLNFIVGHKFEPNLYIFN